MKKIGLQKLIGGFLILFLLLVSVQNVKADMYITGGRKDEQVLGLWFGNDAQIIEDGGTVKISTSVSGKVITVTMTVTNESDEPVVNGQAEIYFKPSITDNFEVSIEPAEGLELKDVGLTKQILWIVGKEIKKNETASITYKLTAKPNYSESDFSDPANLVQEDYCANRKCIYIAARAEFVHGTVNPTTGKPGTVIEFKEEDGCLPVVELSFDTQGGPEGPEDPCIADPTLPQCKKEPNPGTGIYSDIIILSAIVVAAAGVLFLTLKSNKFTKI